MARIFFAEGDGQPLKSEVGDSRISGVAAEFPCERRAARRLRWAGIAATAPRR